MNNKFTDCTSWKWASSIAVRALDYCAEDYGSGSATVHPVANGDLVETLGR